MDNLQFAPAALTLSKAGTSAGTTTTFTTSAAVTYAIKGKMYSTNAATNAASPTTDAATGAAFTTVPVGYGSVFVLCYDGSSTTAATAIKVVQGGISALNNANDDGSSAVNQFVNAPNFPVVPDTLAPFAYLVVKVGTGGTAFTYGSSNLSGVSKVGYAWQDIATMPARPQVA